mgnify:CR=1 FL=1
MSVAQVKNLQRRLDNLNREAEAELTKACGHELWRTLGFDAFDGLEPGQRVGPAPNELVPPLMLRFERAYAPMKSPLTDDRAASPR